MLKNQSVERFKCLANYSNGLRVELGYHEILIIVFSWIWCYFVLLVQENAILLFISQLFIAFLLCAGTKLIVEGRMMIQPLYLLSRRYDRSGLMCKTMVMLMWSLGAQPGPWGSFWKLLPTLSLEWDRPGFESLLCHFLSQLPVKLPLPL